MEHDPYPPVTATSPAPDSRVLVVYLPHPRDYQQLQQHGWYRIPVRSAPPRLAVSYLAFYLPAAFGALRWSIREYAPLQGWQIVPRRELLPAEPDHPRALQPYYRLEVGPLQALPQPLLAAKLRRITFIETSFAQLCQARDVRELWQPPENHDYSSTELWAAGLAGRALR